MKNVLEFLEATAGRFPEKVCFEDEIKKITFDRLVNAAKRIGCSLTKAAGRKMNQPVAIMMEKGVDCVTAMMGVLYSGNFYSVIDMSSPKHRIETLLGILEPQMIIADTENAVSARELAAEGAAKGEASRAALQNVEETDVAGDMVYSYNELLKGSIDESMISTVREAGLDIDPVYLVFTSGSTGVPKGVLTPHRAVINLVSGFIDVFNIDENDIHGNQAPLDYDASVKDIYSCMASGAKTYFIPSRFYSTPKLLFDCIEEQRITTLVWAVSALCIPVRLKAFEYKVPTSVKKVLFSGAVMLCRYLKVWQRNLPEAMFVNLYGATETTCNCTYHIVDREVEETDILPIGRPFPNVGIVLLKDDGTEAAGEEQGEICVRGAGLAIGYYGRDDLTELAFPYNPRTGAYKEHIYRSGDIGSYSEEGLLMFHGRRDYQVKHLGHRIELGEIEIAASDIEGIGECCCLYNAERSEIVLFYSGNIDKKGIAVYLRERLPRYMLPMRYARGELPHLPNGKLDRGALKRTLRDDGVKL